MPDKTRKSQVFRLMPCTSIPPVVTNTIAQLNTRMTVVRIAVARLEFRPDTPILARNAVNLAKNADENAQKNHFIGQIFSKERFLFCRRLLSPALFRFSYPLNRTKTTRQSVVFWQGG